MILSLVFGLLLKRGLIYVCVDACMNGCDLCCYCFCWFWLLVMDTLVGWLFVVCFVHADTFVFVCWLFVLFGFWFSFAGWVITWCCLSVCDDCAFCCLLSVVLILLLFLVGKLCSWTYCCWIKCCFVCLLCCILFNCCFCWVLVFVVYVICVYSYFFCCVLLAL